MHTDQAKECIHIKVEMHHTAGTHETSWAFVTKKLKKLINIYIHTYI